MPPGRRLSPKTSAKGRVFNPGYIPPLITGRLHKLLHPSTEELHFTFPIGIPQIQFSFLLSNFHSSWLMIYFPGGSRLLSPKGSDISHFQDCTPSSLTKKGVALLTFRPPKKGDRVCVPPGAIKAMVRPSCFPRIISPKKYYLSPFLLHLLTEDAVELSMFKSQLKYI